MRRFVLHNILHADDPPHRLALGIAVGVWVTFTPTIGLQMLLVVALAWLLGANKVVGLPVVWVSNPVTFVPIFWPSYWLGATLLGRDPTREGFWRELIQPPPGWWERVVFYWSAFMEIAGPIWLGSLIVGTTVAAISYLVANRLICAYRIRRWGGVVPPSMALVPAEKSPLMKAAGVTAAVAKAGKQKKQSGRAQRSRTGPLTPAADARRTPGR